MSAIPIKASLIKIAMPPKTFNQPNTLPKSAKPMPSNISSNSFPQSAKPMPLTSLKKRCSVNWGSFYKSHIK